MKVLAIALSFLAACSRPQPLPDMGEVPYFDLTSETGQPFDSKLLDGRVWVANFIFTNCTGPCPTMSRQMRTVQSQASAVRLVSFSVDPARDTAEALAAYAKRYQADPARWCFLTGDPARLNDLAFHTFKLNRVDGSMSHSTRFVLVDRKRRIRGFYITSEENFMTTLLRDIRRLEREKS